MRLGPLERRPVSALGLLTTLDCVYAAFIAVVVIRPETPLPSWADTVIVLGLVLGAATLLSYLVSRARSVPDRRPRLAILATVGWVAIFVAALGPLGTPPPWWFGPSPSSWLAPVYQIGLFQAVGLGLVVVGLLDAGALARRTHASRG